MYKKNDLKLFSSFVDEKFVNELDFNTLEQLNKNFIIGNFKTKESDLIYRINFNGKDIYLRRRKWH